MAYLKKLSYTKPLPADAMLTTRGGRTTARWTVRGERREAPVVTGRDGTQRVRLWTATWHAYYQDASGAARRVDTGCEEKAAAQVALAGLLRQEERIKSGLLTPAEAKLAAEVRRPFLDVVEAFVADKRSLKRDDAYCYELDRMLRRLQADCRLQTLGDLTLERIDGWKTARLAEGLGVTTVKRHVDAARGLARWCVRRKRLPVDPLVGVELPSVELDRRRVRRAYTASEFMRLLQATAIRPARDAALIRRGPRKGQFGKLRPEVRERLVRLGRERKLIYCVLLETGLRLGELRSVRVGQAALTGESPHIDLTAGQAKARHAQRVELSPQIAGALEEWVRARGLGPQDPLLRVPDDFDRVLRLDAALAGLELKDAAGKSLDLHALRHTLNTRLADGGVPLVVAQALMRHSDPRLTAHAYVDREALSTKKPAMAQLVSQLALELQQARAKDLQDQAVGRPLPPVYNVPQRKTTEVVEEARTRVQELVQEALSELPGQDSNLEKQDQNLL